VHQVPLAVDEEASSEAVVEQLLESFAESAQLPFDSIKTLLFRRLQESFDPLTGEGYTVVGAVLRLHETTVFPQIGTKVPLEAGGNKLPVIAKIDQQIDHRDMVFPAGTAFPAALRADLPGAHCLGN
jgi:hypothetical protein